MSEISEKEGSAAKAAAARLVEAEREITGYQAERERWINYTTDLQRIIEALCNRRGLPEPVSTARHHYEMAREYLSTKAEAALSAQDGAVGVKVECPACRGNGVQENAVCPCEQCAGTGTIATLRALEAQGGGKK